MKAQRDIVAQYVAKRNQTVKSLTDNFGDFYSDSHNDLAGLVELINLTDRTIQHLLGVNQSFASLRDQMDTEDKSLTLVQQVFSIDRVISGDSKAKKWLGNALYLVLGSNYSFNGISFTAPDGTKFSKMEILESK